MKKILTIILIGAIPKLLSAQISGYLYYNTLQYNAAYAGQDSLSIMLSTLANTEYLKPEKNRRSLMNRALQLQGSYNIKKLNSGVGISAEYDAIGNKNMGFRESAYNIAVMYNYNIQFNDHTNIRLGARANELITKLHLEPSSYYYFFYEQSFDTTISDQTLDPALWFNYRGANIGFTIKNVFNNDITFKSYYINAFYDRFKDRYLSFVFALNLASHESRYYRTVKEINPHVNIKVADVVLLNIGYDYLKSGKTKTENFTFGAGAKIGSRTKILLNYLSDGKYNSLISLMIKLNL